MTARVSPPVAMREQHASKGKERARVGLQHSNVREYATSLARCVNEEESARATATTAATTATRRSRKESTGKR